MLITQRHFDDFDAGKIAVPLRDSVGDRAAVSAAGVHITPEGRTSNTK